MLVIAGGDGINRRGKVADNGALQVLRLETFSSPAAGSGAVIAEGTTHAIVIAGAGQQSVDLLGGSLRTTEPELQHAPHGWRQLFIAEQLLDRLAIELLCRATLLLQPLQQSCDLVDSSNDTSGELSELGIDLGRRIPRDPARGFGKLPINIKAARIDLAAECPQRLFCS